MKTTNDFSALSAKGLDAVAHASQRGNIVGDAIPEQSSPTRSLSWRRSQRNVTLGSVTYYKSVTYLRAAMLLLLAMTALTAAWAQNVDPKTIPLTLEAKADGTITVYNPQKGMQYYKTGGTKTAMSATTQIQVTAGQTVQFYGNGTSIKSYWGTNIDCSADCYIYGNIMSLVDETGFATNTTLTEDVTFSMLFYNNAHLKNHPDHQLLLPATKLAKYCYSFMFYGCTGLTKAPGLPATELKTNCYENMFQGCTALTEAPELPATTLAGYCYSFMFYGCTGLTKAPDLPATKLAEYCYYSMFFGCTGLTKAPELPATTLAGYCYENMFTYCTGLTEAPVLPATTLAAGCYQYMFQGCSNLNTVKCLATDISARDCTLDWLDGVAAKGTFVKEESVKGWTTGVSGIPDGWTVVGWMKLHPLTLEAIDDGTITVKDPKEGMQYSINGGAKTTLTTENNQIQVSAGQKVQFYGDGTSITKYNGTRIDCSADCYIYGNIMSLVDETGFANNTTLTEGETFISLFYGNSYLKNHPDHQLVLPATTLAQNCYQRMFYGCRGLTKAPELPATELAEFCYASMFEICTGLTVAPELPATTLAEGCYLNMFEGCTGLTTAPDLPATTLAEGCYAGMFHDCTNLSYVRCMATDISDGDCTTNWLNNVASQGTFVKAEGMEDWDLGASGIPSDWTVVGGMKGYPLTLEAKAGGTITVTDPKEGMQYSINGGKKRPVTTAPISISAGQKVQFYGNGTSIASYDGTSIGCSADCYIYGNIMSLVDEMRFPTATELTEGYTFWMLFKNNANLKNHPDHQLLLPATELADGCYSGMFDGCTGLTEAPELPATTLAYCCYQNMFQGCTGLTVAPELPATTLAYCCYDSMFQGCTGLTVAPELPATTLAGDCYMNMFTYCTGLTEAPVLPATTLADGCYQGMFQDCSNLNYVKCLATDISANDCTTDWLDGVAAQGTFVKAESMESWTTGVSGIPDGWTLAEGIQLQPLTLEAIADGTITVVRPQEGMQYSINGGAKTAMSATTEIQVRAGQKVKFYGKGKNITSYSGTMIQCSANCYIYGNIMSLVDEMSYEFNTTLTADNTFEGLFSANIYLKNHSTNKLLLPATTLTKNCYSSMFNGCTGLTTAPELPATTLAEGCYVGMFQSCSGLTAAPDLLAPTLAKNCYKEMFRYCSNLNFVKCMATDISADDCTTSWLGSVASEGIFLKAPKTNWSTGNSGIPNGWTPKPYTPAPALTLEAIADGTIKVLSPRSGMKYSIDGGTKTTMTATTEIPVTAGQKVQLYGNGKNITSYNGTRIQCSNDCYIYGNIMSLVDENEFEYNITLPAIKTFYALFYNNSYLKNHPDKPLVLPAMTLKLECYYNMFYGCSGLTTAPELPATTLTSSCYYQMFEGCKGLTVAPDLPATTLATSCYSAMFYGCTSLTEVPKLSATELAASCYSQMFLGCTSLTKAPELLATTLTENCYANMFYGCRNLNYVKCLATDISATNCTMDWLKSVAAQGLFVKAKNTSWSRGASGIPDGWTVVGPNGITLYDTGDNLATLEAKDGQTLDFVMLDGRTLYKDGYWNTLCLPFDVEDGDTGDGLTFSGTPLEGATVMELDTDNKWSMVNGQWSISNEGHQTGLDGSTLYLYFQNANKIVAGRPYIIRWGTPETPAGGTISDPVLQDVKVSNTTDNVTFTGGSFKGTYESTTFYEENQSILFLGEDNTLYYPEAGATIGAQRAYFQLSPNTNVREFVLRFGEEETQGIKPTSLTPGPSPIGEGSIYTLNGVKVNGQRSMVNGQQSMVNGQQSMVNGQQSMVNGQRSMVNGQLRKGLYIVNSRKVVIK